MNSSGNADVIIIGRGGGSMEDLWAFNSMEVVNAVIASGIPVISAVGHETDFTLCDFVADMRAPTPSAAAELAVPDSAGVLNWLRHFEGKSRAALERQLERQEARLAAVRNLQAFKSPLSLIETKERQRDELASRLNDAMTDRLDACDTRLREAAARLAALNPLAVLARGYALAYHDGHPVHSVTQLAEGDGIALRLSDGTAVCTVGSIAREDGKA